MQELIILDLDGVIIKDQSQIIFLNYLRSKKIIGLFFYFKIYIWFTFYKLGLAKSPEKVVDFAYSFLKGKKQAEIDELVHKFFIDKLREFIFSEIIDIINEHKARGREFVIISAAVSPIVREAANFLGIKNIICTELGIERGIFTGKILGKIIYGKNKKFVAEKFINENNFSFGNSYAYADHISDLNLLLAVSKPCVVNPDRFLHVEAKKRNWPILIFKK